MVTVDVVGVNVVDALEGGFGRDLGCDEVGGCVVVAERVSVDSVGFLVRTNLGPFVGVVVAIAVGGVAFFFTVVDGAVFLVGAAEFSITLTEVCGDSFLIGGLMSSALLLAELIGDCFSLIGALFSLSCSFSLVWLVKFKVT